MPCISAGYASVRYSRYLRLILGPHIVGIGVVGVDPALVELSGRLSRPGPCGARGEIVGVDDSVVVVVVVAGVNRTGISLGRARFDASRHG